MRNLAKLIFALAVVCQCMAFRAPTVRHLGISSKRLRMQSISTATSGEVKLVEPFGVGLMSDVRRKLPFYKSDFIDGLNIKSLSSSFFLFFACLAPAVAFGGLLGTATNGLMGTMETVGATAIGGLLYALFSAQPLTIIGTTGPLLAFVKVLHDSCVSRGVPFLPMYAWTGLWSSLFLYMSAFFSTSNVVEYFTRFTDDIFSSLISVIFIYEAVKEIAATFANPAIAGTQACFTLITALMTFGVARTLSGLRKTQFLNRKVRDKVSDFAPTLGVLAGVGTASMAIKRYALNMPMLNVPSVLGTTSGRPWLVDVMSLPNNLKLLCILPALMATVLLFMDQNITVRLMMSKENKLKKGSGLHLDMLVVALVTTITSLLGMPWMVAATVRSLAHMRSLREYETQGEGADGTPKIEMTGVKEQRVTGLLIHSFIGAAIIFYRDVLRQLPTSVLTGLFLYLGISSINTTDLWSRFLLFFTDPRDVPKNALWKVGGVALNKTKLFTAIQLTLLGAMWWLKGTKLGVFFPVLIGLLAPARIALERFNVFSKTELESLDGEIA